MMIRIWRGIAILIVSGAIAWGNDARAQVKPDATLGGESSVVTPDNNQNGERSRIAGGAKRGENLFHSFEEFNVDAGRGVYFNNPAGVENIISRVTGSNASNIQGTLGVLGNANLFLLNPNGIIFGANASLNLRGSFFATTASSLNFADGSNFSATEPQKSLLTVSIPLGLQFNAKPGSIINRSQATPEDVSFYLPLGLQVPTGKTLALVGGDVALEGGIITAPEARIELGSVGEAGIVRLTPIAQGWVLGYEGIPSFQDIRLSQQAFVDASGEGGGAIQVQAKRLILTDASQISTVTLGSTPGRDLIVNTTESVELRNTATDLGNSALIADTQGIGNAGNIVINTKKLILQDGSQVSSAAYGFLAESDLLAATGKAGNVTINASELVELVGVSSGRLFSGLSSATYGAGDAGDIVVNTKKLTAQDGGLISTASAKTELIERSQVFTATAKGGNLTINATDAIELTDGFTHPTGLSTQTLGFSTAGNIILNTGKLIVQDNAGIAVSSQATGDAGNLNITASNIRLNNEAELTATTKSGRGGGNINIDNANLLLLRTRSEISTNAAGDGMGGNINIDTNLLAQDHSDITANAIRGMGGNITINTQGIFRTPDSKISAISQLGVNGVVSIKRLQSDPNPGLISLPDTIVDTSRLIAQGCGASGINVAKAPSSLTVTGRGGMPPDPQEVVNSEFTLADLGSPAKIGSTSTTVVNPKYSQLTPIVEAQAWSMGKNGEVVLSAQLPNATGYFPWFTAAKCQL